jgi:hypothetical protein
MKIAVARLIIDQLSWFFLIQISINDITVLADYHTITLFHCHVESLTKSIRILKLCFQCIDLGSWYFSHLDNISRREVLLIKLKSPVITWPAGLYMNGELAQVESGNLVNIVIIQQVFVVEDLGWNKCSIGKRDLGTDFKMGRKFRYCCFFMLRLMTSSLFFWQTKV